MNGTIEKNTWEADLEKVTANSISIATQRGGG